MPVLLPALLHAVALLIGFGVQAMASPLASAWFLFFAAGCGILLYNGQYKEHRCLLAYACLLWLVALGISTFLLASINGAAAVMWMLATMPLLALTLRREHLRIYVAAFLAVEIIYAAGIIIQWLLNVQYVGYVVEDRYSWPLLDPNNGAAILNMALAPSLYMVFVRGRYRWLAACALFAAALWLTGSKAGGGAIVAVAFVLLLARCGIWGLLAIPVAVIAILTTLQLHPDLIVLFLHSAQDRIPIWIASWKLLGLHPWTGLGLGSFAYYYNQIRTEHYTAGFYAHNDLLQISIEMGYLGAFSFALLIAAAIGSTNRNNLASGVALLAVFLQSLVEFQFYVPAISMLCGLALGCHIINRGSPQSAAHAARPSQPARYRRVF